MKLFMTPAEVAETCFGGNDNITQSFITEEQILTAQRKYIRPVLGSALWEKMEAGGHQTFFRDYVRPALALYVKRLALPAMTAQTGALGVVSYDGGNVKGASQGDIAALSASLKAQADTLMKICVEYLADSADAFPEYDPRENIRNSVSTEGGIVL